MIFTYLKKISLFIEWPSYIRFICFNLLIKLHVQKTMSVWTAVYGFTNSWKSNLSNKIKQEFFQVIVVLVL